MQKLINKTLKSLSGVQHTPFSWAGGHSVLSIKTPMTASHYAAVLVVRGDLLTLATQLEKLIPSPCAAATIGLQHAQLVDKLIPRRYAEQISKATAKSFSRFL